MERVGALLLGGLLFSSLRIPRELLDYIKDDSCDDAPRFGIPFVEVVSNDVTTYSACGYGAQKYRHPMHHEGLPWLHEVFHTGDSVWFAALNPGTCESEWINPDPNGTVSFFVSSDDEDIHFICEFADGTNVTSDPIPPVKDEGSYYEAMIIMIRCDIPSHLQVPSVQSIFNVSLHATVDLEPWLPDNVTRDWQTPIATGPGSYENLRVCPREWPDLTLPSIKNPDKKNTTIPKKRHTLSMVTQIRMEYEGDNHETITIPPENIVTWIEYNLLIGFEHFYIFDNGDNRHGLLELLLAPYIQDGTVTYVWYNMPNCYRHSNDASNGTFMATSQAMLTNTALRRYEHETEWMGHFDVDEFLQLPDDTLDVKKLLSRTKRSTVMALQEWYHECEEDEKYYVAVENGTYNLDTPELFPLSRELCVRKDPTPGKSIMRTEHILGFLVHKPWVKTNHYLVHRVKEFDDLFVAHMRHPRSRDKTNIRNKRRRPLVKGAELRKELELRVKKRLALTKNKRVIEVM
ncbi:MAG: hypothetical protein SGILL_000866 [Bacillariaceae sp.]